MDEKKTRKMTVRLTPEDYEAFRKEARAQKRSVSSLIYGCLIWGQEEMKRHPHQLWLTAGLREDENGS